MRFLLDQNISPLVAAPLRQAGHDVVHARDLGLSRAPDEEVLAAAVQDRRVLVSSDTDFGELLARTDGRGPSLVLLRRQTQRRADDVAALILLNLDLAATDLERGAVVVFDGNRLRIRSLPIGAPEG